MGFLRSRNCIFAVLVVLSRVMQTLLNAAEIEFLLPKLVDQLLADTRLADLSALALVGIKSRGDTLAHRLAAELQKRTGKTVDVGGLDITMYRDDFNERAAITIPQGTDMNFRLDGRNVVLVDDVLETGRSVRAALDALVDFGRPNIIRLLVLIERSKREYPIAADFVGMTLEISNDRKVLVRLKPGDTEDVVYAS